MDLASEWKASSMLRSPHVPSVADPKTTAAEADAVSAMEGVLPAVMTTIIPTIVTAVHRLIGPSMC
jgi:hypothetical protein